MSSSRITKFALAAALFAGAGGLAACGQRQAEVQTPNASAEVSTSLPENAVSDAQLNAVAANAAAEASTPDTNTTTTTTTTTTNTQ